MSDTDTDVSRSLAPLAVSAIETVARSRLLTVSADALLVQVAALLSNAQISVVVVCDDAGAVQGLITETLLVRQLGLGQADFFTTTAGAVMTRSLRSCQLQEPLAEVLSSMHEHGLVHMLLTDAANKALGVVTVRDGLRALLLAGKQEEALLRNYVMGVGYQ
ncbi:cyclic nucleotide-binding/CBS domain-containing protein [Paucibacter sp. Y2R2-4]|uniref:CBS domain-containing protein n=1 Tax=Paucibacter sp. Y2R2-4 TaxID=2893553 RepID=UPI0021E46823|nr:CBS domain-containing protein [Paucibacter sp. Y2R2-4]MCV2352253.1 CBS domain-containing protein [Paucibacter sp. Y2R2-4]